MNYRIEVSTVEGKSHYQAQVSNGTDWVNLIKIGDEVVLGINQIQIWNTEKDAKIVVDLYKKRQLKTAPIITYIEIND